VVHEQRGTRTEQARAIRPRQRLEALEDVRGLAVRQVLGWCGGHSFDDVPAEGETIQ
jgi:hypothetical protein